MIEGLIHHKRKVHYDERGRFEELLRSSQLETLYNIPFPCRQISLSESQKNVVRGLHCSPYHKIVSCAHGAIWDVVFDLRPDSPTHGQIYFAELNDKDGDTLIIPPGLGHGFCALSEHAVVVYGQGGEFVPEFEREFSAFDPEANIPWPISKEVMIMSAKDKVSRTLADIRPTLDQWFLGIPRPYSDVILIVSNGYVGQWF